MYKLFRRHAEFLLPKKTAAASRRAHQASTPSSLSRIERKRRNRAVVHFSATVSANFSLELGIFRQNSCVTLASYHLGTVIDCGDDSGNSANLGIVIEVGEREIADPDSKVNGSAMNNEAPVDEAAKMEDKCSSFVIDVNCNDAVGDNQRVCRICHLSAEESGKSPIGLIELGCACKGELGVAHLDCAEAWFSFRGHRVCEICGDTAINIKGVSDYGFMEAWNGRSSTDPTSVSSEGSRRCLQGQPLCNFLMACLVIAFVLPWFFRVNMF